MTRHAQRSFRDKLVWPGMVFGLIGISLTLMSITFYLAVSDESFGVEEDYYAKAVSWDESAADLAASRALGWNVDVTISPDLDLSGKRGVMVVLTDAQGEAVEAGVAPVFAFHHARRKQPVEFELARIARGRFSAGAPLERNGLWQVRLRFERGHDVFYHTADLSTHPEPARGETQG
ncbi:MAG: FixH family protein [Planctomycetota bacterium]